MKSRISILTRFGRSFRVASIFAVTMGYRANSSLRSFCRNVLRGCQRSLPLSGATGKEMWRLWASTAPLSEVRAGRRQARWRKSERKREETNGESMVGGGRCGGGEEGEGRGRRRREECGSTASHPAGRRHHSFWTLPPRELPSTPPKHGSPWANTPRQYWCSAAWPSAPQSCSQPRPSAPSAGGGSLPVKKTSETAWKSVSGTRL